MVAGGRINRIRGHMPKVSLFPAEPSITQSLLVASAQLRKRLERGEHTKKRWLAEEKYTSQIMATYF